MKLSLWHKDNAQAVVAEAQDLIGRRLPLASRRRFLARGLTLGGLCLLGGCRIDDNATAEAALQRISRINDWAQGRLFDPALLAPTYPDSMIARPFPFNAFYGEDEVPRIDGGAFRLEVSGRVSRKQPWALDELRALPQSTQVTRHICVEGWSAIGKWGGPRLGDFLRAVGADLDARYVGVHCADDYYTSIDMATALHPQTLIALDWDDRPLPPKYGFPMKLRIPTKLGYKNPKHVRAIFVSNTFNRGYWEDQGYNWFGGS
ncbi:molybdopterin-dependent oxidoreductase [Castellaniella defragrans]|uniref:DMSO/TMAO reductase YedYZ molybdopterin-dependent catalytic subunit n=1 Tax=Castellaniella defragrans TaxID=75697 RepID=A0A7W9TM50_CASDE|nr:molybdopterin-dependent oxidoreductase [Castellaniella defragrans]KAB0608764.1 molybdopterin-dependent oxidoreductase [Castellaniella defragrans]MBB6082137.1 DMSO/TMAO reductase YedYZ molybdopterin-dependent catalytic subunit [Castellaniella defragrans]